MQQAILDRPNSTTLRSRSPRIALVTDSLVTFGGAEQIFLYMAEEFAEADIFTLAYRPKRTLPEFKTYRIRTSLINSIISSHSIFKMLFPISTIVMESWILGDYDVVLISSATTAKYLAKSGATHICYCYFPTRALWSTDEYFSSDNKSIVARIFRLMAPMLRRRELSAMRRIDYFIAISNTTRKMIAETYGRPSDILFCPIPVERFRIGIKEPKEDFFLLVSRLEEWKRVDYAIEAFNRLKLPLRVIGIGDDEARLRALAGPTVTFLGRKSMDELVCQYGRARAVVFTPALEYGLVPLEAVAAGTPVIALGYGGVLETMVGLAQENDNSVSPTAVFFAEQTAESLMGAVRQFETMQFDRETLSAYAERFGVDAFKAKLRRMVDVYCKSPQL